MLFSIGYYLIFGKPLIFYLGVVTYLSFTFTAILGYSASKGKPILPFVWHPRFALTSLVLGAIHGFLAISVYLNI